MECLDIEKFNKHTAVHEQNLDILSFQTQKNQRLSNVPRLHLGLSSRSISMSTKANNFQSRSGNSGNTCGHSKHSLTSADLLQSLQSMIRVDRISSVAEVRCSYF